jgi:hypothetical protein
MRSLLLGSGLFAFLICMLRIGSFLVRTAMFKFVATRRITRRV